jgi:hypothetical protein
MRDFQIDGKPLRALTTKDTVKAVSGSGEKLEV